MATNVFKQIYDELISKIKTQFPRFIDPGRCVMRDTVKPSALGYEDCIIIRPSKDDLAYETAISLTGPAKIVNYRLDLVYFKKMALAEDKINAVTAFAEDLEDYLLDYVANTTYWVGLETDIIFDVDDEVPEGRTGISGFVMDMFFTRLKT